MRSEYFRVALQSNSSWRENSTRMMEFKDLQLQTILLYLHFLYSDSLPPITPSRLSVEFSPHLSLVYPRFVDFLIDLLLISHRFNEPSIRLCVFSMIPLPSSLSLGLFPSRQSLDLSFIVTASN